MDPLHRAAYLSVARACGFAGLAIFCVMAGLSFEPVLAARTGGVLTLVLVAALLFKSFYVRYQDYRKTELWMILDKRYRPPEAFARRVSMGVLRETYLRFAQTAAAVSVILWVLSLLLAFAGIGSTESFAWTGYPSKEELLSSGHLLGKTPVQGNVP